MWYSHTITCQRKIWVCLYSLTRYCDNMELAKMSWVEAHFSVKWGNVQAMTLISLLYKILYGQVFFFPWTTQIQMLKIISLRMQMSSKWWTLLSRVQLCPIQAIFANFIRFFSSSNCADFFNNPEGKGKKWLISLIPNSDNVQQRSKTFYLQKPERMQRPVLKGIWFWE